MRRTMQQHSPKPEIVGTVVPRRGFALIEVLVGGLMLAIGLATVISMATQALRVQTDSEKQLQAIWLADEILNMVLVEGPAEYPKLYDTNGRYEFPYEDFWYDVSIEDQGTNQPFSVTATIFWQGPRGERSVQVHAYISERGGDPYQPRIPLEPVDREARWFDDES